ncbi:MAG: DUF6020 family protein [Acidimicrobiia bacterium]
MTRPSGSPKNKALWIGLATGIPLLVWWAGFFPGLMSSDSIDQWNQVLTFEFQNAHPIAHTASMWGISLIWESPGAVALAQVLAAAVLFGFIARRLVQIGVPLWLSASTVWVIALLPMTGATTITLWKDIPFGLAMGWVFTELVLLAKDRDRFWGTWAGPLRLGSALGLMWALRANGKYTVLVFLVALAIGERHRIRGMLRTIPTVVGIGVVVPAILIVALPVTNNPIEPAQVFMPDVAAVIVHDPETFDDRDMELIAEVAPIAVWTDRYVCGDSSPLLFDPEYSNRTIQESPWDYRGLVVRTVVGAPGTVAGHRWCAGEYLISPINRTDTFVHRPPYNIWPNTLGLARDSISDRAFAVTSWMYVQAERSSIEWLTWRPALVMLIGLATFAGVWSRRRLWPLGWIGGLFVIHLANVFFTSPSHEFRYAFGLYLIALASLPLWYLITDPERASIAGSG